MKKLISRVLIAVMMVSMLLTMVGSAALAAQTIYVKGSSVYVRKGPGLDYGVLGTVHDGDAFSASSTKKDDRGVKWYKIDFDGRKGWISSKYVTTQSPFSMYPEKVYATKGSSYIRKAPDTSADALTTLSKGDVADYTGESQKDWRGVVWYKVIFKGYTGWVSSRYTSLDPYESEIRMVVAVDGSSYIRTDYNINADVITTLSRDNEAFFLEETRTDDRGVEWYKVETKSGKVGWVSSRYTEIRTRGNGGSIIVATEGSTFIRKYYSINSDVVTSMTEGAEVYYLGETKRDDRGVAWYKVKTKSGKVGWVSSKYVTKY